MNYIAYKNIDGTITSGFKVKLYDIVTLNTGYWKDKLASDFNDIIIRKKESLMTSLLPSSTGGRHGA